MSIFKSVKKRIVASVIGATMLFSLVPAAFASTADAATVNTTVNFVNQTSDGSVPATLPTNVSVSLDPSTLVKDYLPTTADDPLPGKVSVLDCVIAAVGNYSKTVGWDAAPLYGDPGAWIDDMFGLIGFDDEDDTAWFGKGWTCKVNGTSPIDYLSNVEATNNAAITMTFASYNYPKN